MKQTTTIAIAILSLGGLQALTATAADESKPATSSGKKDNGLVAYWKFDEPGASDVCADASGNGYDATPNAPVERGTGKFGTHCISLAGGQVFGISEKMPRPSAPMSISAWVKPRKLEGRQYILTFLPNSRETHGDYEYALHLDYGGEPRFWVWGHPTPQIPREEWEFPKEKWGLACKTKLSTNEWAHVVVTIGEPGGETSKPSNKEGAVNLTYTMYVNGKVVAREIYPVPPYLPNLAHSIGGKPKGEMSLDGDIDELMVFNRTLAAAEVEGLYAGNALPKGEGQ